MLDENAEELHVMIEAIELENAALHTSRALNAHQSSPKQVVDDSITHYAVGEEFVRLMR
jgi:hypothetical protein